MPMQNTGTLLENFVLVETARLAFEARILGPVEFVNSFAMPPLSVWRAPETNGGLEDNRLQSLRSPTMLPASEEFAGLFRACILHPPLHRGPNGALLVGLLARHLGLSPHYWLNDITTDQRYPPDTISELVALPTTLEALAPNGLPLASLIVRDENYPDSLDHLASTLQGWASKGPPSVRIGYLDPDHYVIQGRQAGGTTSSPDHRRWLDLVRAGVSRLAISVHFSAFRIHPQHLGELAQLREDAQQQGYQNSVTFMWRHFSTTVSVFHPEGSHASEMFQTTLRERIRATWARWRTLTGRGQLSALREIPP